MLKIFALAVLNLILSLQLLASPKRVAISWDYGLHAPRWMFGDAAKNNVKTSGIVRKLHFVKKDIENKNFKKCILRLNKIAASPGIRPWLVWQEIGCALRVKGKKYSLLKKAINKVKRHKHWLYLDGVGLELRKRYYEGLYVLYVYEVAKTKQVAWQSFSLLVANLDEFDKGQKANIYKLASDLAFSKQKFSLSVRYIFNSLKYKESKVLRNKLNALKKYLPKNKNHQFIYLKKNPSAPFDEKLISSEQELKLIHRMQSAMKTGELLAAVDDGVQLIREFPGSVRSKWAYARIKEIYYSLAPKTDSKYLLVKLKMRDAMKRCDGLRIFHWARYLFWKGYYEDSLHLNVAAYEKLKGQENITKVLMLMGQAAQFSGKYDHAKRYYLEIVKKHAGTPEFYRALFNVGVIDFSQKNFGKSQAIFERLVAFPLVAFDYDELDLSSKYLLWRSLQKMGQVKRASEIQNILIKTYPLTYYGLRARAELNKNHQLDFSAFKEDSMKVPSQLELWMTDKQYKSWEQFVIFVQAGWFLAAQKELALIPKPETLVENVFYAKLWGYSLNYFNTITLMSSVWNKEPLFVSTNLIPISFPIEFQNYILTNSKKYQLNPNLMMGLIRQESSYLMDAKSPVGAMGLMQLMPPTAREIAVDLRYKSKTLKKDLMQPQLNIRFGSYYYKKVLKMTKGNIPVALAAYNVGIGNMRKWFRARKSNQGIYEQRSSDPVDELWMEELPWSETRGYVKSILRNYLIYEVLNSKDKKVSLKQPIWL